MTLDQLRNLVRSERNWYRTGDARRRVYRLAAWSARDLRRIAAATADRGDSLAAAQHLFGRNPMIRGICPSGHVAQAGRFARAVRAAGRGDRRGGPAPDCEVTHCVR